MSFSSSSSGGLRQFTVGALETDGSDLYYGQCFAPNMPGPSGWGNYGSAKVVGIRRAVVAYPDLTSTRADRAYIYSVPLSNVMQIGQPENLVAASQTCIDGSAFGSGSYTRSFYFPSSIRNLNIGDDYYLYFDVLQTLQDLSSDQYPAGAFLASLLGASASLQFLVEMYV